MSSHTDPVAVEAVLRIQQSIQRMQCAEGQLEDVNMGRRIPTLGSAEWAGWL
jgi:hypothetical protein